MAEVAQAFQARLDKEVSTFQGLQKEYAKAVGNLEQLESQYRENELVLQEMKLLKPDAKVYKLVGPLLMDQDPTEAKSNVEKRMEYIKSEVKRVETQIKDLDEKQDKKRDEIMQIQKVYQEKIKQ